MQVTKAVVVRETESSTEDRHEVRRLLCSERFGKVLAEAAINQSIFLLPHTQS